MRRRFRSTSRRDDAATTFEYAVMLVLAAITLAVLIPLLVSGSLR